MSIETVYSCPLGAKCKEVKDGAIHQCLWLVSLTETNKVTLETRVDESCAIASLPALLIEIAGTNLGQTDALCSMRDETLQRQDLAIAAMVEYKDNRHARIIEN
jgi:hypothetical protein